MQLVIPKEFVSDSAHSGKYDVTIPTVGDLVNRRKPDRFPFITMDASLLSPFDSELHPELSDNYCCMTVQESVFELQANAVDVLTGKRNGHTEVLDLQDIRAGCSAYIAGKTLPRDELLQNGGMMYQYTKYLTSDAPMVDSIKSLIRDYVPDAGIQDQVQEQAHADMPSGRNMRDLDSAVTGISDEKSAGVEFAM